MTFQMSSSDTRPNHSSIAYSGGTPSAIVLKISVSVLPCTHSSSTRLAGFVSEIAAAPSPSPRVPWQEAQNLTYTVRPAVIDSSDMGIGLSCATRMLALTELVRCQGDVAILPPRSITSPTIKRERIRASFVRAAAVYSTTESGNRRLARCRF